MVVCFVHPRGWENPIQAILSPPVFCFFLVSVSFLHISFSSRFHDPSPAWTLSFCFLPRLNQHLGLPLLLLSGHRQLWTVSDHMLPLCVSRDVPAWDRRSSNLKNQLPCGVLPMSWGRFHGSPYLSSLPRSALTLHLLPSPLWLVFFTIVHSVAGFPGDS